MFGSVASLPLVSPHPTPPQPSPGSGVELLSFPLNSLVGEAGLGWAGLGEGKVTCVVVSPGLLWEPALLVLIFITYYSAL